jgi:alkylhydroperoxidase/carboxymuconolactone decarboxylase family protein
MAGYYHSEDLARFGGIAKSAPPQWETFFKWYTTTMEAGAVDAKTKKLVALAVAYAIQEPYCIDAYTSACTDAGATPEELAEVVNVAAVIRGGGVLAHWAHSENTLARKR